MQTYKLINDNFDQSEINAAIKVLRSGKYTMGKSVEEFEKKFAKWVGAKYAVMVNSGSSANLLILETLIRGSKKKNKLRVGDEVIVPALSWPTTIWPILQLGLKPVFIDSNLKDLAVDVERFKKAINNKTKAIFLTHILGNCADIKSIVRIAKQKNILLLEDCCESLGAYYKQKHVGNFGIAASFSHYFSHHICTIEGGTVTTNDPVMANDLRSTRAHGWVRNRSDQKRIINSNKSIDSKFLFVTTGFNVRPTEINGAIGLVQLKKLESFLVKRDINIIRVSKIINKSKYLSIIGREKIPKQSHQNKKLRSHSWFTIPLIMKKGEKSKKQKILKIFKKCKIDTRPIIAGNLLKHPAMKNIKYKTFGDFKIANEIFNFAFMIGCSPDLKLNELKCLEKAIKLSNSI